MSVTFPPETYDGAVKSIQRIAEKAFSGHVLTEIGPNEWHCAKPNRGDYSFHVIVRPGTVVFYGDLGEAIFRCWDADALNWLKRAVHSSEYLLEKLRTTDRSQEPWQFYAGDALAYLRELVEDGYGPKWEKALKAAEDEERWGNLHAGTWREIIEDAGGDSEMAQVALRRPATNQWFVEALRWLVEHLPKDAEAPNA